MQAESRLKTGIVGLDAMLNGGFIPESSILVRGAPGTGKTTLAFHFLLEGIRQGESGLFISFEEFPQSLYRDAASLGWNLAELETSGKLHMLFTSPQVLLTNLASPNSPLLERIMMGNIQRVVVDSITHFTRVSRDSQELRTVYNRVINAFRRENLTSMLLAEELQGDSAGIDKGRLAFVVDCMVLLRYLEIESAVRRAILVLKMRSSNHDKAIHEYRIGPGGITVGDVLEGHSGLLSGLSHQSIISAAHSIR